MLSVIHSEECRQTSYEAEAWALQYPKHCKKCLGAGFHYNPGVRYYADGSGEPPSYEPCSCVEEGLCPRCQSEIWAVERTDRNDYFRCPTCGWDEWLIFNPASALEPKLVVSRFLSPVVNQEYPCECVIEARLQDDGLLDTPEARYILSVSDHLSEML